MRGSDDRDEGVVNLVRFRSGLGVNPDLLLYKGVSGERIAFAVFAD